MIIISLIATALAFTLSASAGLGGSLILVPAMAMILGSKQGIAISALLLGCNNITKIIAYRHTVPINAVAGVMLLTILGAATGAKLMIAAPEHWVDIVIITSFVFTFLIEQKKWDNVKRGLSLLFAFCAGATSGVSGTSGPLKGIALRSLNLNRYYFVGAASIVSLAGDATKVAVFINEPLFFEETSWMIVLWALLIMPGAVFTGRFINAEIGERAYTALFWAVMVGYTIRLLIL